MGFTSCRAITGYLWCNEVENRVDTAAFKIACDEPSRPFAPTDTLEPLSQSQTVSNQSIKHAHFGRCTDDQPMDSTT